MLLKNSPGKKQCTFFCTGNVAEKFPELIQRISCDGHEIACHAYQHVDISKLTNYEFEKDLEKGIHFLNKACGKEIKGYRAPMFSLPKDDHSKYSILEKYFQYDSSLVIDSHEVNKYFVNGRYKNTDLRVLPLLSIQTLIFKKKIIGGTYLKVSSLGDAKKYLTESLKNALQPIIYMHPYEFDNNHDFWVSLEDLKKSNCPTLERFFYQIKQHQWHSFNASSIKKLSALLELYPNIGRADKYLEIE